MHIAKPDFNRVTEAKAFECQTFRSTAIKTIDLKFEVSGQLPETSEISLEVEKKDGVMDVAVCIPSNPIEQITLRQDFSLRGWWNDWGHNISSDLMGRHVGPIFLVLEKTDTKQVANTYYKGRESSGRIKILGKIANLGKLAFEAGYSLTQLSGSAFEFTKYGLQPNDEKWSIFIRSEKLKTLRFWRLKDVPRKIWK